MSIKKDPDFYATAIADLVYKHCPDAAIERVRALIECTTIEDLRSALAALKDRSVVEGFEGAEVDA